MRTRCEECDKPVFDNGLHCVECSILMCEDCALYIYRTKPACKCCAVDFQPKRDESYLFMDLQLDVVGKFVGRC
jgi:hypothetical protein